MHKRIATLTLLAGPLTLGCVSGPASSFSRVALENATSDPGQIAPAARPAHQAKPVTASAAEPTGPRPEVSQQDAMRQIAPMLAQLSASDAKLHAEVLDQLAAAKPSLWSLTVQRALNTSEYRQQLTGQSTTPAPAPPAVAPQPTTMVTNPAATAAPVHLPPPTPPASPTTDANVIQASAVAEPVAAASLSPAAKAMGAAPETIGNPHFDVVSSQEPVAELDWREHLGEAIEQLKTQPRTPGETHEQVRLQLMQLVAGETDHSTPSAPGLPASEQGYWSNQIYALATLLSDKSGGDRLARADAAARHQSEASAKLREFSSLRVQNFVTCKEVYGFGAYEPLAEARYAPGDQVILYAEIDNYQSDVSDEGYRTTIASSYRLVGLDHNEIVGGDFPEVDDLCLTRRRDFHIQYGVTLPGGLTPGDYRLELTVRDRLGEKVGHDQLMLTIVRR
ncbi:hypothetical protein MalM25_24570 [Planctomycetes bacterium MalM25]|nr:hypothetical protein MalM25_24570 [Planctomycetes bacterium MalM25]